jgi:LemA protein
MPEVWIPVAVASAVIAAWLWLTFNGFVRLRNMMRQAWSDVDVQLKRRHDLIPKLTNAVRGFMEHERGLLTRVTEARGRCMNAATATERVAMENALSSALRGLVAVIEDYPEVKAAVNVLDLQANLVDVEDHIQMSRRYYNGTVRNYNTRVESFPSLLVARLYGFEQAEFFELESAVEAAAPEVELGQ